MMTQHLQPVPAQTPSQLLYSAGGGGGGGRGGRGGRRGGGGGVGGGGAGVEGGRVVGGGKEEGRMNWGSEGRGIAKREQDESVKRQEGENLGKMG